jgi:hypothetical protein
VDLISLIHLGAKVTTAKDNYVSSVEGREEYHLFVVVFLSFSHNINVINPPQQRMAMI